MIYKKSLEHLQKSRVVIPKGTQTLSKSYDQWALGTMPIYIKKAKGSYIFDVDGNRFLDLMGGLGPIILGYNHNYVNKAIKKQMKRGSVFSLSSNLEYRLAKKIVEVVPCAEMVRFGKNGSDVASIAIRLARAFTGKEFILTPEGHYHGWADTFAASSSLNKGFPGILKTFVENFVYNDTSILEEKLRTNKFAAVIMEPVRLDEPKPGFLQEVRKLCDKYNAILIFDEIVTGFRWTLGGAQEYYGVTPDITTIGKAMSNGMPISAVAGKKEIMSLLEDEVFFSGTYLGENYSIASAIATIEFLEKNKNTIYPKLWKNAKKIKDNFNYHVSENLGMQMVGTGPLLNIKFSNPKIKDLFCKYMAEEGVFTGVAVYVTNSFSKLDVWRANSAVKKSLKRLNKVFSEGSIDSELGCHTSKAFFRDNIGKNI